MTTTAAPSEESVESIVARMERLPFLPFHWRISAILGVGTYFDAFDSLVISVVLTVIIATFKIGFSSAGFLISGGFVGQFIGALTFGSLSERFGRKPMFIIAISIFGTCALLATFAQNFQQIIAWRLIQGFGLGAEVPLAAALFSEFVRGSSRGKNVLIYETTYALGLLSTPLIGLAVISHFPPQDAWRVLFLIGAIPLAVGFIAWRRLPESPRWLASKGRIAEALATIEEMEAQAARRGVALAAPRAVPPVPVRPTRLGELLSSQYRARSFLVWTQWFVTYFGTHGYSVWLPLLYVKLGGLPASKAVALQIVPGVLQLVLLYVVAFSLDRVGRKPWFITAFACAALAMASGYVLVVRFGLHGWPILFGVGVFFAVSLSISAGVVYVYTPELFPTRMRAWATSTGSASARCASFISPAALGLLLEHGFGVATIFLMYTAVMCVGLVVTLALAFETKDRVLEDLAA